MSPARREAVVAAVAELGYRPNAMARSLVARRTRTMGVLVSDLHNPFFAEVLDGVATAADRAGPGRAGYTVLLVSGNRERGPNPAPSRCSWRTGWTPGGRRCAGRPGRRRVGVPAQVSVVGYDNSALAGLRHVALTSVNQPRQEMGRRAAELLLRRLDAPDARARSVTLAPELVVRATSGLAASG